MAFLSISIHVPAWGTTLKLIDQPHTVGISIHVPAWGTTTIASTFVTSSIISIHVPAWGTTYAVFLLCSVINYFNPRSRVGNDL